MALAPPVGIAAQVPFGQLPVRHWTLSVQAPPTSIWAAQVMPPLVLQYAPAWHSSA